MNTYFHRMATHSFKAGTGVSFLLEYRWDGKIDLVLRFPSGYGDEDEIVFRDVSRQEIRDVQDGLFAASDAAAALAREARPVAGGGCEPVSPCAEARPACDLRCEHDSCYGQGACSSPDCRGDMGFCVSPTCLACGDGSEERACEPEEGV